jgi:hypothetical protein
VGRGSYEGTVLPTSAFEVIGAAVIVLGVPAFLFTLFEILPVLGAFLVVLVFGALGAWPGSPPEE